MPLRHHSLVAWQRADDLFLEVHKLARQCFPADERLLLGAQIRRAAYSVPANIVEGFARSHARERLQFLRTAWASLAETGYCLHAARRLGYINESAYDGFEESIRKVAAPLGGLIKMQRAAED